MNSNKHLNLSIDSFTAVATAQADKGIKKYGKTVNPLDDYDWLQMAQEEMADGYVYLEAEKEKRKFIVAKIRSLLNFKTNEFTNMEINHWLDLLEGKK